MPDTIEKIFLRDEEDALQPDFVRSVSRALKKDQKKELRKLVIDLHESDLADLLELAVDGRIK